MAQQYIAGQDDNFTVADDTSVTAEHAGPPFHATNTLRLRFRNGLLVILPAHLDTREVPKVNAGQALTLMEDAAVGFVLPALTATGLPTSWNITGGNVGATWGISSQGGLTLLRALDFTATAIYTIYVTATNDVGTSAPVPVSVSVTRRVVPKPEVYAAAFNVHENVPEGTTVGTVIATNSPTSFQILGSGAPFTITSAGVLTVTGSIDYESVASYTLQVVATNAGGTSEPAYVVVTVLDVVEGGPAPASFIGVPIVTETLTVDPGGYDPASLFVLRNGRIAQPATYPMPLTNVDAHKDLSIARIVNGEKLYETTPIRIGQPVGPQSLLIDGYGANVPAVTELVGQAPALKGSLTYRGPGGFGRRAGGGNYIVATADTSPGRAGVQLGADQMNIEISMKEAHQAYYIELGFCMDGPGFLGGGYSYSNKGYSLRLDKNWNASGSYNVTLTRWGGPGDATGQVLWTGTAIANTVRTLALKVVATGTSINLTIERDNGATMTATVNDATYRGEYMLYSISRLAAGTPEWTMKAGVYEHEFIPEADQYIETYNDEFTNPDLTRFRKSTAKDGVPGTYSPECPWDLEQIINYQASRDTHPEDVGKIGATTPLGIQPLSVDGNGTHIKQWRATPAEIAKFNWSDDATYRAVMDRDVEKWLSGTMSSQFTFNQQYGRVEWVGRMSSNAGRGGWGEIWLYPLHLVWVSEIDFPELLGDKLGIASMGIHQRDVTATTETITTQPVGLVPFPSGGNATDLHRYSIEWLPDRIVFEIDGKVVGTLRNHTIHERMFMIIRYPNGSVDPSGNWVMPPNSTSPSPSWLTTRALRAYQRPSQLASLPKFTSKPKLTVTPSGYCTWTYGASNGTPTKRWLAKSTTRIAGTENQTSYQLLDADRKRGNKPNDYGVEISVLEEHVLPGGGIQRVRSEVYWVTQSGASMTSGQAPADYNPDWAVTPPTSDLPTPPVTGLTNTFDYKPSRDGLSMLSGGPLLEGYQSSHAANPTLKWMPRFTDGSTSDTPQGTINFQQEAFMVDPAHVSAAGWSPFVLDANSDLQIRAMRVGDTPITATNLPLDPSTNAPYQWVTGMASTQASFQQYGGYFEAEMKGETGPGNWWSFWTLTGKVFALRGEVDIVEVIGNTLGANGFQTNVIVSDAPPNTNEAHQTVSGGTIASTFHRYGAYVTDTQVQFYLDGVALGAPVDISNTPKMVDNPHSLILTNFVGSHIPGWVGHPDGTTKSPSPITVRRVTAWQRTGPVAMHASGTAYPDTLAVGGVVATLSATTFGASTGLTYSLVDNPGSVFSIVGSELRLASTGGGASTTVRLRVVDSSGRSFARRFTFTKSQWVPTGAVNVLPSSTSLATANETPGVTIAGNLVTETTAATTHGTNWLNMTRTAGVRNYVALIELSTTTVPMFNVQVAAGGWGSGASTLFNLNTAAVHFSNGYGGWTHTGATITPVSAGRYRLRVTFTTDGSSTGVHALFRFANAAGDTEYAGSTSRSATIHEVWLYQAA